MTITLTRQEAKANFLKRGESIQEWADRHEFPARSVYAVLNGKNKGNRGVAHKIAVALRIKETPQEE